MRFRRTSIWLVGALFALSACSSGTDDASPVGQAGTGVDEGGSAAPVDETRTELVVAVGEDTHPGSEIDMKRLGRYPLQASICEGLVRLNENFEVEGMLAESWKQDGNTLRFHLRDDVTFHDGSPLTAAAVVESMNYQASDPQTSGFSQVGPESTVAVDEDTVEITPDVQNLRLLEQITHPTYWITGPGSDPLEDPESITCTGPYMVEEYAPEDRLTVVRNADYWGEPAVMEKVTFRFIPDPATRALALQSGEVDVAAELERAQIGPLADTPGLEVIAAPPGQVHLTYFAFRGPDGEEKVLGERAVREAIATSIDQQAYVDGVLDGRAEVVATVNPPAILGEHASLVEGFEYDQDEARRLLEEAGWQLGDGGTRMRGGEELQLELIFNPSHVTLPTAEFVQSQLAEVGIGVDITQHADTASYGEQRAAGDFDINIEAPNQNDANPAFLLALRWFSEATGDNVEYVMPGPETRFNELIGRTMSETDPQELVRLAAEAMHELVDVEVATVPLAGTYRLYAMKEELEGFVGHPSGTNQAWDTIYWSSAE